MEVFRGSTDEPEALLHRVILESSERQTSSTLSRVVEGEDLLVRVWARRGEPVPYELRVGVER